MHTWRKHSDVGLLKSETPVMDFLHTWRFSLSNLTSLFVKDCNTDVKCMEVCVGVFFLS